MAPKHTAEELVGLMNGDTWLRGWDVLVAYDEDLINTMLEASVKQAPKILDDLKPFQVSWTYNHRTFVTEYHVSLGIPTLKFVDVSGTIDVTFAMSGYYIDVTDPSNPGSHNPFPENQRMVATTYLYNVSGNMDESQLLPAGVRIDFDQNVPASKHIAVAFEKPSVKVIGPDGNTDPSWDTALSFLTGHIANSGFVYRVLGIQNKAQDLHLQKTLDDSFTTTLEPSSMVFSTVTGDPATNTPGSLLIWINMLHSTSSGGQLPSAGQPLLFQPGPDNASRLSTTPVTMPLANERPQPSLLNSGYTEPKANERGNYSEFDYRDALTAIVLTRSTGGMQITARFPSTPYHIDKVDTSDSGFGWNSSHQCDGMDFNANQDPVSINFVDHGATVSYSHTQRLSYGSSFTSTGPHGSTRGASGSADFTLSLQANGTWSNPNRDSSNRLLLSVPLPATLTMNTSNVSGAAFGMAYPSPPSSLTNLQIKTPTASMDSVSLDYFLTTNLLFPDQHVFDANEAPGSIWHPRDTLLTGKVTQQTPTTRATRLKTLVEDLKRTKSRSETHKLESKDTEGVQTTPPTFQDLKNDILSLKPSTFLGSAIAALAAESDPDAAFETVLVKHNYDSLSGDEFGEATGIYSRDPARTGNKSLSLGSQQFDIRYFGAFYDITAPESMRNTSMVVDPHSGNIKMNETEAVTSSSVGQDGKAHVTWTLLGNSYDVVFISTAVKDTASFTLSFEGTVRTPGGVEPFKGKQSDAPRSSSPEPDVNIVTYVGFGLSTVLGLFAIFQSWWYRRQDKKEGKDKTEAGKERMRQTDASRAEIKAKVNEILEILKSQVREVVRRPLSSAESDRLRGSMAAGFDQAAAEASQSVSDVQWHDSSLSSQGAVHDATVRNGQQSANDAIESANHSVRLPAAFDAIGPFVRSGLVSNGEAHNIGISAISEQSAEMQTRLNASDYPTAQATASIASIQTSKLDSLAKAAAKNIDILQQSKTRNQQAIVQNEALAKRYAEEAAKATDEAEKTRLERLANDSRDAVKELEERQRHADKQIQDEIDHKQADERSRSEAEDERRRSSDNAEEEYKHVQDP
ncbi:hypothetical protein Asppvi_011132 [Aspergillus pseudoviridinutans]|uniref:Uncharacterized protein n=1 Tax=Aspergillus pseudoviridinutans TaxID=1517512 RepID=A0A9P3EXN6_9EURO|nr:uncharacterized protein Asppvi_011132 [Aspergillus pseudoviridinutans]GIJ92156.1 hypothetical protein Asppvi_011132 [Aspergillus pseudoviridinutans]